jgi:hypothetical protein
MKRDTIRESLNVWLEENHLSMGEFQDWYSRNFLKVPVGALRRMIGKMNKIAEDDRLGPNRRLLAAYQASYWSAKIMGDTAEQALLASVILGEFVNRNGFRLVDSQGSQIPSEVGDRSKVEISAMINLREAFSGMKENLKQEGFLPNERPVQSE